MISGVQEAPMVKMVSTDVALCGAIKSPRIIYVIPCKNILVWCILL